ncbi:hypothetical protein EMIHUDRAFT_195738 [Emiliania huxleyi CCMP1516]|uniref:Polycystin cation channel PKD1/PKD2 domain-containing protein n=2 Tax=Emiliania huxleyi TaxID=2903 RepID=A0A0D3JHZ8_EMIH1|nr:hypothetical protein EMIHUDRAFT_195738 [Emiliania huxleyi CCMP1516]EOD23133.1 hypothetical protein EMIHUDRAFT_195738 [Emiliania huxleyi CCMP1516]|eukprot:XP_005775562.1 hypothetical protein EMIHUDRAFT_195738 [Emiliania huxleyi CCMP1516]
MRGLECWACGLVFSFAAALALDAQAQAAPTALAACLVVASSSGGALLLANALVAALVLAVSTLQRVVFGRLRVAERQRTFERIVSLSLSQLVALWAVVGGLGCALSLYSGLCRDRLDYLVHLPEAPSASRLAAVLVTQLLLLATTLGLLRTLCVVFADAGVSALALLLFQPAVVLLDGLFHLLGLGVSTLLHHAHLWYARGLHFSVVDMLLLANTKAAFESLQAENRSAAFT